MFDSDPAQIIPSAQDGTPLASEGRNGKTVSIVTLDRDTRRMLQQMIDNQQKTNELLTEILNARS